MGILSRFTRDVAKDIQECQKLGIMECGVQVEYAILHADEYESMKVSECADFIDQLCRVEGEESILAEFKDAIDEDTNNILNLEL